MTLLHSVSVIINFVIPKRDKKQRKTHHTFSSTAGTRPTISTMCGIVIEEVHTILHPQLSLI